MCLSVKIHAKDCSPSNVNKTTLKIILVLHAILCHFGNLTNDTYKYHHPNLLFSSSKCQVLKLIWVDLEGK